MSAIACEPGVFQEVSDPSFSGKEVPAHHSRTRIMGTEQVVEFVIGDELFAVDLFDTRKVITTPKLTSIPNAPPFVTGMIDLRVMMHITRESSGKKRSWIIVLDKTVSEKMIGILVDDVY